jgi:hypothetical protein
MDPFTVYIYFPGVESVGNSEVTEPVAVCVEFLRNRRNADVCRFLPRWIRQKGPDSMSHSRGCEYYPGMRYDSQTPMFYEASSSNPHNYS